MLATACNLCNHKNYKTNTNPNYKQIQHWGGKIINKKGNTTYISGFAVLFFDGMSKERNIQKDTVQSVKEWKHTKKIQNLFGSNGQIRKNTKCICVVLFLFLFFNLVLYFCFTKKQYECNFSKNTKYKKHTNQTNQKYKMQKQYKPNISKMQNNNNNNKNKFKNEPESQPHVHFEKQEPICKINAKPTCFIFQTLQFRFCIFELFFFVFFSSCMFNSLQKTLL